MAEEKKHSKGILLTVLLLAVLAVAALCVLGYFGINVPFLSFAKSSQFKKALDEHNYQAASTVLNGSVSKEGELSFLDEHLEDFFNICFSEDYGENTWSEFRGIEVFNGYIKDKVLQKMDETVTRFYQGELSKDDAKKYIARLGKFSFASEKLTDCVGDINEKEASSENYNQGISLANEGKFEEAVALLKKVSERDTAHYSAAQDAINTCKSVYGASKLSEAQNYIDTHQTENARKILNSLISLFGDYPEAQALLDGLA